MLESTHGPVIIDRDAMEALILYTHQHLQQLLEMSGFVIPLTFVFGVLFLILSVAFCAILGKILGAIFFRPWENFRPGWTWWNPNWTPYRIGAFFGVFVWALSVLWLVV